MPNFKVLQDVPSALRSRFYGVSDGTDFPILVDSSGVLAIQDNGSSITVDANDLDIRNLTNSGDSVLIYGNDGTDNQVILTDASGVLAIQDNGSSITVDANDLDIRNLTNSGDSVLIYGNDGTDNQVILTDASGVLAIQDNGSSITVDANDLDIRNLTNSGDSVLIYGNDGTDNQVILTDASGVLQVSSVASFVEDTLSVTTVTALVGSTAQDASRHPNYTWFVKNTGATATATVRLEISPNETDWLLDGTSYVVGTSSAIILEPNAFLRYTRVAYQSTTAGADTSLDLIWQAYS